MRIICFILLPVLLFANSACQSEKGTNADTSDRDTYQPPCQASGTLPPPYSFVSHQTGRLVRITTASDTSRQLRKLEVLRSSDCALLLEKELASHPMDAEYRLADLEYNSAHHLVGISGNRQVMALQLDSLVLTGPLDPQFGHEVHAQDAQSGQVIRLEVWEEFLVGFCRDYGEFVFDLRDMNAPRAILPFREWKSGSGRYHSLYLLPSEQDRYQALLPMYDQEADVLQLHSFFQSPVKIDPDAQGPFSGSSPVVQLTYGQGESIEINLETGQALQ